MKHYEQLSLGERSNLTILYGLYFFGFIFSVSFLAAVLFKFSEENLNGLIISSSVFIGIFIFTKITEKFGNRIIILDDNDRPASFSKKLLRNLYDFLIFVGFIILGLSVNQFFGIDVVQNAKVFHNTVDGGVWSKILGFWVIIVAPIFPVLVLLMLPPYLTTTRLSLADFLAKTHFVISRTKDPKKILQKICGAFAIAILIFFSGFSVFSTFLYIYNVNDVELHPNFNNFFITKDVDPKKNFHAAWAGIYAPEGQQNLYTYGLDIIAGKEKPNEERQLRFKDQNIEMSEFCYSLEEKWEKPNAECLSNFDSLIEENTVLLNRYQNLQKNTKKWKINAGDKIHSSGTYGQDVISLHRLLILKWINDAEDGNAQKAIDEWLIHTNALQNIVSGKINMVEHAVWMVVYSMHINALTAILDDNQETIIQNKDRLISVLQTDYLSHWNVEDMLRAEYNNINATFNEKHNSLYFKINDTRNQFYDFAQEMIRISNFPASDLAQLDFRAFREKHARCAPDFGFSCWGYNSIGNIVLGGMFYGTELLLNGHNITAKQRALILWLQAKAQNIPTSEMKDFLNSVDSSLFNPFTNKPYEWQSDRNTILFHVKDNKKETLYLTDMVKDYWMSPHISQNIQPEECIPFYDEKKALADKAHQKNNDEYIENLEKSGLTTEAYKLGFLPLMPMIEILNYVEICAPVDDRFYKVENNFCRIAIKDPRYNVMFNEWQEGGHF